MSLLRVPYKMLLAPIPPFPLGPGNTALLLIDAQHFTATRSQGLGQLANERGIDREFDEYYAQVDAALPNMTKLIAACRARGRHGYAHRALRCPAGRRRPVTANARERIAPPDRRSPAPDPTGSGG
jgi:nicotinamidase-related amidase